MKTYIYDKKLTGYYNIHSFIRRNFEPGTIGGCCNMGNVFIIQSQKEVCKDAIIEILDPANCSLEEGERIYIECLVAFCNRGRLNKNFNTHPWAKLNSLTAIDNFETLSGLKRVSNDYMHTLRPRAAVQSTFETSKFVIGNIFMINGIFVLEDKEKFEKALREGIGSRKSYGFGLIMPTPENVILKAIAEQEEELEICV